MKKILLLIFIFASIKINAQYYDNCIVDNVNFFIAKNLANKNIRDADVKLLKENKVRIIKISTGEGKITGKVSVNLHGQIENYMVFDEADEMLEEEYRFGYDMEGNLVSCTVKGDGISLSHIFTYENNMLASVDVDSLGFASQYVIARDEQNRILKTTLFDLQKDSLIQKYFYHYDENNRVIKITDENYEQIFYKMSYGKNRVSVSIPLYITDSYEYENDRITNEAQEFPMKTSQSRKAGKITFTEKYSYLQNGLIESVKITGSKTGSTVEKYEYAFYE